MWHETAEPKVKHLLALSSSVQRQTEVLVKENPSSTGCSL